MKLTKEQILLLQVVVILLWTASFITGCWGESVENPTSTPRQYYPPAIPGVIEPLEIDKDELKGLGIISWATNGKLFLGVKGSPLSVYSYDFETGEIQQILTPGMNFYVAISPDGSLVVYPTEEEWIIIRTSDLTKENLLLDKESRMVTFSPDNKKITYWKGTSLYLLDLDTREEKMIFDIPSEWGKEHMNLSPAIWNPSGDAVVIILGIDWHDTKIERMISVDPASGESKILVSYSENIGYVSWSPNGRFLVYAVGFLDDAGIEIFDTENQCVITKLDTPWSRRPYWSPDGKSIAFEGSFENFLLDIEAYFGVPYEELSCID